MSLEAAEALDIMIEIIKLLLLLNITINKLKYLISILTSKNFMIGQLDAFRGRETYLEELRKTLSLFTNHN